MFISIDHTTDYTYDEPIAYYVQRVRLTPLSSVSQTVHDWAIDMPGIEDSVPYTDGFGNTVHLTTYHGSIGTLSVNASGVVETKDAGGVFGEDASGTLPDVFLRKTDLTCADKDLTEFGLGINRPDRLELVHEIMRVLHEEVDYDSDATHAGTNANQAFHQRRGVCQDHTHIFLAIARLHGIPARYVTGYLDMGDEEHPSIAHHAWAEAYIDGLAWVGFDPVHCISPSERYVRLACGFDAPSSAPLTGMRRGGGAEKLDVAVTVRQVDQ